jgi:proteasome accessory factor A
MPTPGSTYDTYDTGAVVSVHRIMGIETEYGITVHGHPTMNAMLTSSQVVNAYAAMLVSKGLRKARWDYEEEFPLRDARGFDLSRADADPSQLTDEDLGLANVILTNGARLYVDHAHPEYSSPEVTNPRDAALWDRAGAVIMAEAARLASSAGHQLLLYKNNTDNKGASYGCHENYLMRRETPFADIVRHLTPFFITRQVFTGTGRLGVGQEGRLARFQLTQRADFFEVEVGLETTLKRPIINTRDEPHANPERHRRLHVIVGDANLSDVATYVKMGTTSLVLAMLEDGFLSKVDLRAVDPVAEMHAVSHDVTLTHRIRLQDGRSLTALEIQQEFWQLAREYLDGHGTDELTEDVMTRWARTLEDLGKDPALCADVVDWVAKWQLLDSYRQRDGLAWDSMKLQAIDLQYSDVRPDRGLAGRLEERGRLKRMFTDSEVAQAVTQAPSDTRAWFRGECMRRYGEHVAAASWDSVVFDLPGSNTLIRVPTMEPSKGTQAQVEELLNACPSASDLVRALELADSD